MYNRCVKNRLKTVCEKNVRSPRGGFFLTHTVDKKTMLSNFCLQTANGVICTEACLQRQMQ